MAVVSSHPVFESSGGHAGQDLFCEKFQLWTTVGMTPSSGGWWELLLAPVHFSSLYWQRKKQLSLASGPQTPGLRTLLSHSENEGPQIQSFPGVETKTHHDSPHCSFYNHQTLILSG